MTDSFDSPDSIISTFASADSFRGRLVLIEVTGFEKDVPVFQQPGKFSDRVTATVTPVDGKGRVQVFSRKTPTGVFLDGPAHAGVWFNQTRIVQAVAPKGLASVGRTVLATIETYKLGQSAGLGNPWGLINPTEEQKQVARDFLANKTIAEATTPVADEDPWAAKA